MGLTSWLESYALIFIFFFSMFRGGKRREVSPVLFGKLKKCHDFGKKTLIKLNFLFEM